MSLPGVIFGSSDKFDVFVDAQVIDTGVAGLVRVPHGDFLLSAEYARVGPHLSLSEGETSVLVKNFFTFKTVPDLLTEDGSSVIDGALAIRLAGPLAPGQFAQVGQLAQVTTSPSIGVIEKLEGIVSLTRTDGATVQAAKGTQVFTGDIVKTGADANVGIKFIDETNFALGESGRMVIDEMIYDPGANTGSSSFSVVKGVFSFVSGKVAKFGDDAMVVKTPVASIGVRGTTVAGKAAAEGTSNSITLLPDADGGVGQIAVTNSAGTQVMSIPFQTTTLSSAFTPPSAPVVLPSNQLQNLYGNIKTSLSVTNTTTPEEQSNDAGRSDNEGEAEAAPEGEGEGDEEGEGEGAGEGEGEGAGEGDEDEDEEGDEAPIEGEGDQEEDEEPGEGDGPPGEGDEGPGEDDERTGEGDGPPGEGDEGPGEGEEGPGEGDGRPDEGQGDEIELNQQEARGEEVGEEVREREVSEEEAFEREAEAAGNREEDREIADEAFREAIQEGADPREAAFRAEEAVRENKVDRSFESLEEAVGDGRSLEEALGDEINRTDGSTEDLFLTREGAFRSLENAFRDPNGDGFSKIVSETANDDKKDEQVFRDVLLSGGDIGEAFSAAFESNVAAGSDRIEANIFTQGFDPGLKAQSRIIEQVNEAFIQNAISSGLVSDFTENITLTAADDNVSGTPGPAVNTIFVATQGSTLGGNDTIDGGAGTDQLNLLNLSDLLIVGVKYSNPGGAISGSISLTNVEQINFFSAGGDTETFGLAGSGSSLGTGFVVVGTSGNDTLSIVPDGSSAADVSAGTVSLDIDGNGTGLNTGAGVLFADGGNDTITFEGNRRVIFGGGGDDLINIGVGEINVVQGGAGNDTFVLEEENSLYGIGGRSSSVLPTLISGGDGVDTLQIGNSSTAANQTFTVEGFDNGAFSTISGMEKLHFFQSGTVFRTGAQMFKQFSEITAESGVSGVTLASTNGVLNLSESNIGSAVTVLSAIAPATDPTFQNGGVRIFDGKDGEGRILIGTPNADTLSGLGGNDLLQGGQGADTLLGGDGNDVFVIVSATDLISGKTISGGSGTDTLSVLGSSIRILSSAKLAIETMEIFDLSGGADAGVIVSMPAADLEAFSTITGDGTSDVIAAFVGDYTLLSSSTLTNIEAIVLNDPAGGFNNGAQNFIIQDGATITGLKSVLGTVSASGAPDDNIAIFGDRDLSGIFTNVDAVELKDGNGARQTIEVNFATSFGAGVDVANALAEIRNFTTGTGSTTDVFDYKSNLVAGDGTSRSSGTDLTLTTIDSSARATNVISANSTAVIEFEDVLLSIDITSSTKSEILSAVEALLESSNASTNLTGANAGVTQGGVNTDSLLIFYESDDDAVIIRYLEGSTSEADYSGELFVLSVFDSLSAGSGPDDTFTDTNII